MEVVQQQFLAFMLFIWQLINFRMQALFNNNNTSRLLFVCFYPHVAIRSDDSVDQSTEGVCSSNFPVPFQASRLVFSTQTEEY